MHVKFVKRSEDSKNFELVFLSVCSEYVKGVKK